MENAVRLSRRRRKILPELVLSLQVAFCATLLSVLVGTPVAYLLAKRRFPGRSLAEGLTILPLVLPPTVLGYYLLVLLGRNSAAGRLYERLFGTPLVFAFNGIVAAACVASLPLFVRQAQVAFASVDEEILDAGRMDGAGSAALLRYILLPLARPGLLAGGTLAFARALGDFGATLMVSGSIPGKTLTLPLRLYNAYANGEERTALGLSLLLSAIALTVSVLAARLNETYDPLEQAAARPKKL